MLGSGFTAASAGCASSMPAMPTITVSSNLIPVLMIAERAAEWMITPTTP